MTLGEKIKSARKERGMTQSDISGDAITRNMISAIENGKAIPSLPTLYSISKALNVPISYLLSENTTLGELEKESKINEAKSALRLGSYSRCVDIVNSIGYIDDELAFILAQCYFELGVASTKKGELESAKIQLELATKYCNETIYDTIRFEATIPLYACIAQNINSPLLEFNEPEFLVVMESGFEYEFYKYLVMDFEYKFTNHQFKLHMQAKRMIRERKYAAAKDLLLQIDNTKSNFPYNAYVLFGVYADLDTCYKQLHDFENAYRYASKRLSMTESFTI